MEVPRICANETKVAIAVTVQLDGAAVEAAKVTLAAADATLERVTGPSGDALFNVSVGDGPKRPSKLTVKTVALSKATKLPGLAFAAGSKSFTLEVNRDVPLARTDTSKRVTIVLPSAKAMVTAVAYDSKTNVWSPVAARADFFYAREKAFSTDVGPGGRSIPMLVPPGSTGKDYRVEGTSMDGTKLRDTTSMRVPAPGSTVFLTIYLGDLQTQLERARFKLNQMLAQAYGQEVADRITRGVVFDIADVPTPSYKDGVLHVPKLWSLGTGSEMESIFHEWGHRVQDVLAHDTVADFFVGDAIDSPWAPDPKKNEWRAFDEGRANFYSQLFTASLRYPGDQSFTEAKAMPFAGKCATCPGYLAAVMVAHYRDATLYGNALEIARDFRAVHDEASRTLGRAPRTYAEFVKAKESLIDRQRADGTITAARADAVRKQLRETNARFKL